MGGEIKCAILRLAMYESELVDELHVRIEELPHILGAALLLLALVELLLGGGDLRSSRDDQEVMGRSGGVPLWRGDSEVIAR